MASGFGSPVVNDIPAGISEDICNHFDQSSADDGVLQPQPGLDSPGTHRAASSKQGAASARSWLAAMSQSHDDLKGYLRPMAGIPQDLEMNTTPKHLPSPAPRHAEATASTPKAPQQQQEDQSRLAAWVERTTPYVDSDAEPGTEEEEQEQEASVGDPETPAAASPPAGNDVFEQWLRSTEPAATPYSAYSAYSGKSALTPFGLMHHVAATSTVLTPKPLYDVGDEYSSEEEEQEQQEVEPTPYIAAQAAATPPTAAFSASSVDKLNARIAHMQLVEQQQEGGSSTPAGQKTAAFGRHASTAEALPESGSTPYAGRTPASTPLAAQPPQLPPKSPLEKVLHMLAQEEQEGRGQQGGAAHVQGAALGSMQGAGDGYDSSSDDELTDPEVISMVQRSTGKLLVPRPAGLPVDKVIHMMVEGERGSPR